MSENKVNLLAGLGLPSQIPIDTKEYAASEAALKDLGLNNNLAFTYQKGLIVYCKLEGTRYEWREVKVGEENTGLRSTDFIYPAGTNTDGVDYSNKAYNFFLVNTSGDESVFINAGSNIAITGTGTTVDPFVINGLRPALEQINEGNGLGIIIKDRVAANYGNVGLRAVDLSYNSTTSSLHGAVGNYSFAAGVDSIASGVGSTVFGLTNRSAGYGSFAAGSNNLVNGDTSFVGGSNNITSGGYTTVFGRNNTAYGTSSTILGSYLQSNSLYETVLGVYNTDNIGNSGSWVATDRLFTLGNGINSSNKSDALIVLKNGLALLPSVTDTLIDDDITGKAIVTKEYLDNYSFPGTADGSETKIQAGTNISIVGNGTITTPYIISANTDDITQYTDEMAVDAVVAALEDTSTITYDNIDSTIRANVNINGVSTSTGILSGGLLSVNSVDNTEWDIQAGTGYIYDSLANTVTEVSWTSQDGLTADYRLTNIATYILIDNTGAIIQQPTVPTLEQYRTHIYIGKLAHTENTNIFFAITEPTRMFDIAAQINDINLIIGSVNIEGNVLSANGANLNINVSAGKIYRVGANYNINRNNPSLTNVIGENAVSFRKKFRNGLGSWTAMDTTVIDTLYYDDGTGTLAAVPSGKFTVLTAWRFGASGTIHIDYGQTYYDSIEDAKSSIGNYDVEYDPDNIRSAVRIGWIVVQRGTPVLNDSSRAQFIRANRFGERVPTRVITTLQGVYEDSTSPEITTNSTLGAFTLRQGSGSNSDNVFEVLNSSNTIVARIDGNGNLIANSYNGYTPESIVNKQNSLAVDGTGTKFPTVDAINNLRGVANGFATLGSTGKIPNSQIPSLAISETFVVASQSAMLALSSAEQGDVAVRTDINKSFILTTSPYSTLANWQELLTPTDAVQSVNGQVGVVNLTTSNIPEGSNLYYTESRVNSNTNVAANTAARHNPVTLGTPNGLSLSTQQLSLGLASSGVTGALSGTDWNVFNSKSPATGGSGYIQNQSSSAQSANMWINGVGKFSQITLDTNTIEEYSSNSDTGEIAINYRGYLGGTTRFRNFNVYNGKNSPILQIVGSTGAATFASTVTASNGTLIGGTGTVNYIPKFTGSGSLGNSLIQDNGSTIGIGGAPSAYFVDAFGPDGNGYRYRGASGVGVILGVSSTYGVSTSAQIGSLTSHRLDFLVGASEKASILPNGNFGIGTTTPIGKFQARFNADNNFGLFANGPSRVLASSFNDAGNANNGIDFNASDYNFLVNNVARLSLSNTLFSLNGINQSFLGNQCYIDWNNGDSRIGSINNGSSRELYFGTYDTSNGYQERLRVNTTANTNQLSMALGSSIQARKAVPQLALSSNIVGDYYNATYATSNPASQLVLDGFGGTINLSTSVAGTAGNPIVSESRLFIKNNGNAGIGTTNPTEKLHVNGSVKITGSATGLIFDNPSGLSGGITHRTSGTNIWVINKGAGNSTEDYNIYNFRRSNIDFSINNGSGNIGFGTVDPAAKLELKGGLGSIIGQGGSTLRIVNSDSNDYIGITAGLPGVSNSGIQFSVNGISRAVISGSGNFGIDTTNPTEKLHVNGNGLFTGSVTATAFYTSSDIRLKELVDYKFNVEDIKPITYRWKDTTNDQKAHIGYSAQEIEKVLPDAVNTNSDGYKSVDYIQVLVAKVAQLEAEIINLKNRI